MGLSLSREKGKEFSMFMLADNCGYLGFARIFQNCKLTSFKHTYMYNIVFYIIFFYLLFQQNVVLTNKILPVPEKLVKLRNVGRQSSLLAEAPFPLYSLS